MFCSLCSTELNRFCVYTPCPLSVQAGSLTWCLLLRELRHQEYLDLLVSNRLRLKGWSSLVAELTVTNWQWLNVPLHISIFFFFFLEVHHFFFSNCLLRQKGVEPPRTSHGDTCHRLVHSMLPKDAAAGRSRAPLAASLSHETKTKTTNSLSSPDVCDAVGLIRRWTWSSSCRDLNNYTKCRCMSMCDSVFLYMSTTWWVIPSDTEDSKLGHSGEELIPESGLRDS